MPALQGPPSLTPTPTRTSVATQTPPAAQKTPVVKAPAKAAANPLGLTAQQLQAISAEATAAQLPQMQAIQHAQAQDAATAKAQEGATTGYNQALAGILQHIAPQTQAGFQNAAGADTAFSKGFTDGLAHVQQQMGQTNSDVLGVSGGQVQANQVAQQSGGTGVQNALYGLTGYIPGTGLASEGAAFGAAANAMPYTAARQGQQEIQRIAAQEQANQNAFGQQRTDLAAQLPGLQLGYGNQLLTAQANRDYKNALLGVDTSKLAQAGTKLAQSGANTQSLIQTRQTSAQIAAAKLGISQENAQTAAARAASAASVATKRLTIAKAAAQAKKASVPASLIHEANAAADILYGGIAPKQHYASGQFVPVPGTGQPAELYPAAQAKLLGMGPNTPAWRKQVQAILNARYAPGEGGRPDTPANQKLNKTIAGNAKTGALFNLPGIG